MANGLHIVSSDLPTSKEIMKEFGLYFKNGDVNDLAQALDKATKILWNEKSKEALEIANRFEIKQIINDWKQIIES
jgi:glycosyltransferase involved in cell wall biosynthesis